MTDDVRDQPSPLVAVAAMAPDAMFGAARLCQRATFSMLGRAARCLVAVAGAVLDTPPMRASLVRLETPVAAGRGRGAVLRQDDEEQLKAFLVSIEPMISTVLDFIVDLLPIDAILAPSTVDAIVRRVDVDALVQRVDVDGIIQRVDVPTLVTGVLENVELGDIIADSSTNIAIERARLRSGSGHPRRRRPGGRDRSDPSTRAWTRSRGARLTHRSSPRERPPRPKAHERGQPAARRRRARPPRRPRVALPSRTASTSSSSACCCSRSLFGFASIRYLVNGDFKMPRIGAVFSASAFPIVAVLYLTVLWTMTGRSVGKHLFGLRVVRDDGTPLGVLRAAALLIAVRRARRAESVVGRGQQAQRGRPRPCSSHLGGPRLGRHRADTGADRRRHTRGRTSMRFLIVGIIVFFVATFPASWLLMLFLGNIGANVSYWGTALGILVSAHARRCERRPREYAD